jgi:DNA-binding CsgD family transcriptional regulator
VEPLNDTIVGRDRELATVDAFLAGVGALPAGLLIEGQAGIGKSTIWESAVSSARASGFRVIECRPAGGEVRLSFSALTDLLEPDLRLVLPALPPPQRRALELALLVRGEDDRAPEQRAVAAATLQAIRTLALVGPLLIAIDDAHWLDAASATALEYSIRRLRDEPVAILGSSRSEVSALPPLDLDRALGRRLATLRIGPLSLGALQRMLRERTGMTFDRPTLRHIHDTSGGNPFYALELARASGDAAHRRHSGEPVPLSASLHELLGRRLEGFDETTANALFVAAASANPSLELVGDVVGTNDTELLAAAELARVVRLSDGRVTFEHPLLAAAAYARTSESQRRYWHGRLAAMATDVEERARHGALAVSGQDAEVATTLQAAAKHARSRGAPGVAADLFAMAIARTPGDETGLRIERIVDATPTLVLAGHHATARTLLEDVIATVEAGPPRSDVLLLLSELIDDDVDGSARQKTMLEESLLEAGTDSGRQASALLDLEMWERSQGRPAAALAIARKALERAQQSRDETLLAHALTRTADLEVVLGLGGDPVERFRAAIELNARVGLDAALGPVAMLAVCLIRVGRLAEARPLLLDERRRTIDEGDESSRQSMCLFLTELEWLAGHWDLALAYAREGLDLAELTGVRIMYGVLCGPLALVEASMGDVDQARAHALEGLAICEEIGEEAYGAYNRQMLGFLELSLGNAAMAHAHLGDYSMEEGIEGPKRISMIGDEIAALVHLGEVETASGLVDELERRGIQLGRPTLLATARRYRGLIQAARGDVDGAAEPIEQSLAIFGTDLPFERARTLLVSGEVRRRSKQKRAAREALEEALALFDQVGAPLWAAKARAELARIGGRVAIGGLTATERRVAELVAKGHSNKEVAAELFVSVRAVEANLSKVYAKLDVRSRTELARRL